MAFDRRSLLSRGALFVASGFLAPSFLTRTALALDTETAVAQGIPTGVTTNKNKILVVIQLSGGNDGINTLVPHGDPAYYKLRPTIGIPQAEVLKLNDLVGFHPQLAKLKGLYDQGKVAVVQGVGYPNPNRSHFRSMDIWHSARPDTFEATGWLGRYLDACKCGNEGPLSAVSVGGELNTMFWTESTIVSSLQTIGAYSFLTDTKYKNDRAFQMETLQNIYSQAGAWPEYESLIRNGTLNALAGSDRLQAAAAAYTTPVQYPANNGLANQLKMVAQVISGNLGSRMFSVSQGGFDTHANELTSHGNAMRTFSEAVDAFMQDLVNLKKQDDVVIMVFSEFGRRAEQNGSGGTDHGAAEPMFIIGNNVKGGLYGEQPLLSDLDRNGDIKYKVDFRSVYAGLVRDQLGADPASIVGAGFQPLAIVKTALAAAA